MSKSSKRDWTSLLIQFVPAILGSGVLISTIGDYYTKIGDDPIVRLTVFPDKENYSKVSATLSNVGGGPATNLTASIMAPYNIINNDTFSLEEISMQKIDPRTIQVFMPRLIHGEGSVTTINLGMDEAPNYSESYQTYIVYDQGSNKGFIYEEFTIFGAFADFTSALITPIGILILGISITVALLLFRKFVYKPYRRKSFDKMVNEFSSNMSTELDSIFSTYYRGQKTLQQTAEALALLESLRVTFRKFWGEAGAQGMVRIYPVDDKEISEKHESYVNLILDDATKQFTTNAEYNQYFDNLKKEIFLNKLKVQAENVISVLRCGLNKNEQELSVTTQGIEDEMLLSITTRLDSYLKAKIGIV